MTDERLAGVDAVETIRGIKAAIEDFESGDENAVVVVMRIAAMCAARSSHGIGKQPPPELQS